MPAADANCAPHSHTLGGGTLDTVDGVKLNLVSTPTAANKPGQVKLTVTDKAGAPITSFSLAHGKQMHLILVRDNLSDYLHLHPEVDADGVWSVDTTLPSAGTWRLVADVMIGEGPALNLGTTFSVKGTSPAFTLPAPVETVEVDGITLNFSGTISASEHGSLMITATDKAGRPVKLEQYLEANAHLVAVRTDGAYAHFHPHSMAAMNACPAGRMPIIDSGAADDANVGMMHFMTEVPGAGTYRLFLQFQTDGVLHTVGFTAIVS